MSDTLAPVDWVSPTEGNGYPSNPVISILPGGAQSTFDAGQVQSALLPGLAATPQQVPVAAIESGEQAQRGWIATGLVIFACVVIALAIGKSVPKW